MVTAPCLLSMVPDAAHRDACDACDARPLTRRALPLQGMHSLRLALTARSRPLPVSVHPAGRGRSCVDRAICEPQDPRAGAESKGAWLACS